MRLGELEALRKAPKGFKISLVEGALTVLGSSFISPMTIPLLIRMGADAGVIGLYTAMATALMPPLQILAAFMLDTFREKRLYLMTLFAALNRVKWILILLAVLDIWGDLWTVIALLILSNALGAFSSLAWTDLMADLVEPERRGRLFALRNSLLGLLNLAGLAMAKAIYDLYLYPHGYALAIGIGATLMLAAIPLLYLYGDPVRPHGVGIRPATLAKIFKDRQFLKDAASVSFWNFSVSLVGGVWTYHLYSAFGADEKWFTTLNLTGGMIGILANLPWGRLYDRFGPRGVFLMSGLSIAAVPALFPLLPSLEGQVVLQAYSSFTWTGFSLASFNYALSYSGENRHVYIAAYNSIPSALASLGTIIGVMVYQSAGITVFYVSALCRILAAAVLYRYASPRGVTYEELKVASHLYPLLVTARTFATGAYMETLYTLKVVYSAVVTVVILALLASIYILLLRLFT